MSFYLNDKAEAAAIVVLAPGLEAFDVGLFAGKDSENKTLPCVIAWADGDGEEEPKGTGNFFVDLEVQVKRSAVPNEDGTGQLPDPKAADQALIDAAFGPLMDDGLAAALSAAVPDFTVFPGGIFREAPQRGYDENGNWVDSMNLRLYCCGSSLPA